MSTRHPTIMGLDETKYFDISRIMKDNDALRAFDALSQETRLSVLRLLVRSAPDGLPAGTIADTVGAPASTLSSHLSRLERAQLVSASRNGRSIVYKADLDGIAALASFLLEDCCQGRPEICKPVLAGRKVSACLP